MWPAHGKIFKIGHNYVCSALLHIILVYSHRGYELFIFKQNGKALVLFNGEAGVYSERPVSQVHCNEQHFYKNRY